MLHNHKKIERNSIFMLLLIIVVIAIGGLVQIIPLFRQEVVIEPVQGMRPYTPLELIGQNVYKREGCYNCHSQQIRALRDEVERYGHYSLAAESMYDYPFQWGSKRTGPDLARVGGKYSDSWHVQHLVNPQEVVPDSIMPQYPHLLKREAKIINIDKHLRALKIIGVPYSDSHVTHAVSDAIAQGSSEWDLDAEETARMKAHYGGNVQMRDFDGQKDFLSEMDALIAYMQILGTLAQIKDYDPDLGKGE